jgi:hypothetical protein
VFTAAHSDRLHISRPRVQRLIESAYPMRDTHRVRLSVGASESAAAVWHCVFACRPISRAPLHLDDGLQTRNKQPESGDKHHYVNVGLAFLCALLILPTPQLTRAERKRRDQQIELSTPAFHWTHLAAGNSNLSIKCAVFSLEFFRK